MNELCIRVKVAVAIACIRSKPPRISVREYVERLCTSYKIRQLKWKKKWEESESELLHLKQELLLQQTNIQPIEGRTMEDGDCSQSLFPTPPASGSHGNQHIFQKMSDSLTKHTIFLNQVINIKNASNTPTNKLEELTSRSILKSLELLQKCVGSEELSWKVQFECVGSIVTVMHKIGFDCSSEFISKICDLTKAVSDSILSEATEKYKVQEQRSDLLGKLGSGIETSKPVTETLLSYVFSFSEHLRKNLSNGDSVDPDNFCGIYYIITGLEKCVIQDSFLNQIPEFQELVNEKLEECLLHVTDSYPLFAHALWKICGKIQRIISIDQNC